MADSGFAPSQWETVLLGNDVSLSQWLGANLESALRLNLGNGIHPMFKWDVIPHACPTLNVGLAKPRLE